MRGEITASSLNVRNQAGRAGKIVGRLARGAVVEIVAKQKDWLKIRYQDGPAFVSSRYVRIIPVFGEVTASNLNVRGAADAKAKVLGRLPRGTRVEILEKQRAWLEISYQSKSAFVSGKYVREIKKEPEGDFFWQKPAFQTLALSADVIDLQILEQQKRIAQVWNRYGNLLTVLSDTMGIEAACAVAVLLVESGGEGFGADGRPIIRFENHQFWKYWGKKNADVFHAHFTYNPSARWKDHRFCKKKNAPWEDFHGNQKKEWRVLNFARKLDDSAALKSMSMGAPQIMGFNHKKIGYATVQDMFDFFSRDIRYHIFGLFDFMNDVMVEALKKHDFTAFAKRYNGPGQAAKYGAKIQEFYDAFQSLRS